MTSSNSPVQPGALLPPQIPPFMPGPSGITGNPPPPPDKPLPAPFSPPMPMGMPPMPMGMAPMGSMPMGLPGMPMGMPMLGGPPQAKLPVIVMPFYSPDPAYKDPRPDSKKPSEPHKRKVKIIKKSHHHHHDSDADSSSDTDGSSSGDSNDYERKRWTWKNRRAMRRHKRMRHAKKQEFLTPVLQYVSKDGFVIFEKPISKGEAKDWLSDSDGPNEDTVKVNRARETNKKYSRDEDETRPNKRVVTKDLSKESDHKMVIQKIQKRQKNPRQEIREESKSKQH
ncbi:protein enabled-like [Leguminivora glycinivorella]|uniref:protein enabled-like n=1 Tax=Leguminivora glycinivorella TaxID=1035111 RepID=UPI00201017EC|nr:protein enabled-like [Leguminivora glycinivorella]